MKIDKIKSHISSWINDYITKYNKKGIVIGVSDDIGSLLLLYLSKLSLAPTIAVKLTNNSEILNLIELNNICSLIDPSSGTPSFHLGLFTEMGVLHTITDSNNYINVGSICKNDYLITRSYHKYLTGATDILPLADLKYSQIVFLLDNIIIHNRKLWEDIKNLSDINRSIKNNDISDSQIEWAMSQNEKYNIISNETDPVRNKAWLSYTKRQRECIALLHQIEKKTRHKQLYLPICKIPSNI